MADNATFQSTTPATPAAGTVVAADDVGGVLYQRAKIDAGGDGASVPMVAGQQARAASFPIALSTEDAQALADLLAKLSSDPATQTTLAAILAKLIAAPATEAKQDTGNASLASIITLLTTQAGYLDGVEALLGRLPSGGAATEATLALLKAVFPTTLDTNSGNKSASTLRLVLATDQPTMTNPQPVTPAATESHLGEVGGNLAMISTAFTRPADTTAYTAGDVVGDSTSALTMQALANAARVSGGSGYVTGVKITTDKKSITPRLRLHLFNTNGATLSNDNAAMQTRYADASKRVGYVDLPAMTTGTDSTNSTESFTQDLTLRLPYTCAATSLYYVLEALDAFTPASGQAITVSVFCDRN